MINPLFAMYGAPMQQPPVNNLMEQLNRFKSTITGNPQQIVQNLLNSGRMSQTQFQQYSQMANQILGRR